MITQAKRFLNSASTAEGHRVIDHPSGPIVVDGTAGSVTMCRHPIAEIPKDLCASSKVEDIRKALKDQILQVKLTLKEVAAVRPIFPELDPEKTYKDGDIARQDLALKVKNKDRFEDVPVREEPLI